MDESVNCACVTIDRKKPSWFRRRVMATRRWLFLNVWCRHLYRPTMLLLHRFNLHYAPPMPLSPQYGKICHWCQWCGLRGETFKFDPNAPLKQIHETVQEQTDNQIHEAIYKKGDPV